MSNTTNNVYICKVDENTRPSPFINRPTGPPPESCILGRGLELRRDENEVSELALSRVKPLVRGEATLKAVLQTKTQFLHYILYLHFKVKFTSVNLSGGLIPKPLLPTDLPANTKIRIY
jgi:hypothetical protein